MLLSGLDGSFFVRNFLLSFITMPHFPPCLLLSVRHFSCVIVAKLIEKPTWKLIFSKK